MQRANRVAANHFRPRKKSPSPVLPAKKVLHGGNNIPPARRLQLRMCLSFLKQPIKTI